PGTDLTLGLPDGHLWMSGRSASRAGIPFTANLPTEEVFSIAHKDRVDGWVRASKPLSYGGTLIDGFSLRFAGGKVVEMKADGGNRSSIHVDFMIGSGDLDVDGVLQGGKREPLMRKGEWTA